MSIYREAEFRDISLNEWARKLDRDLKEFKEEIKENEEKIYVLNMKREILVNLLETEVMSTSVGNLITHHANDLVNELDGFVQENLKLTKQRDELESANNLILNRIEIELAKIDLDEDDEY